MVRYDAKKATTLNAKNATYFRFGIFDKICGKKLKIYFFFNLSRKVIILS